MIFLDKFLPKHDKLKHFFFGTLLFVILSIIISNTLSFWIIIALSIIWEVLNYIIKPKHKRNNLKEMILDIVFTNIANFIILQIC